MAKIVNNLKKPLFIGAAFFFFFLFSALFSAAHSNIKIAILDTGFCPSLIKKTSTLQKIHPSIDMTDDNTYNCNKVSEDDLLKMPRFHGQRLVNEFLIHLPPKINVKIYPLVIYDNKGNQRPEAWIKSIEWIKKEKIDFVLTASGLITNNKITNNLPSIWFTPSGRAERFITLATELFPQNLAPMENLFVIGSYFNDKQIIYDQSLLYQKKIDYYFPSGPSSFNGTSRAVAEAMARALNLCPLKNATELRNCLIKNRITLNDPIANKTFYSF